jgi:hypothetical protein
MRKLNYKFNDAVLHSARRLRDNKIEVSLTANIYGKNYDYTVAIEDATPRYEFNDYSDLQLMIMHGVDKMKEIIFRRNY